MKTLHRVAAGNPFGAATHLHHNEDKYIEKRSLLSIYYQPHMTSRSFALDPENWPGNPFGAGSNHDQVIRLELVTNTQRRISSPMDMA